MRNIVPVCIVNLTGVYKHCPMKDRNNRILGIVTSDGDDYIFKKILYICITFFLILITLFHILFTFLCIHIKFFHILLSSIFYHFVHGFLF
jgi:hypothetical protein